MNVIIYGDELYHHGVKGMKWGVRRYQNPDGSLTSAGQRHRGEQPSSEEETTKRKGLSDGQKKAIKIGVAVAGTALAAYGTYKLAKYIQNDRIEKASNEAKQYVHDNLFRYAGYTEYADGRKTVQYVNNNGGLLSYDTSRGDHRKRAEAENDAIRNFARDKMKINTSTPLDKATNKIVNVGDKISSTVSVAKDKVHDRYIDRQAKKYEQFVERNKQKAAKVNASSNRYSVNLIKKNNIPHPKSYSEFSKLSEREKWLAMNNPKTKAQAQREKAVKALGDRVNNRMKNHR